MLLSPGTSRSLLRELGVFWGYLAGAVVFTWPLARDLGQAVTDLADPLLNAWALAWVAHQILRDPVHLFDANIFYPERGTLAFSEHLVGVGVPLAPLGWAFGQPVLTHNVALLLSIALSGFGAYRLARHLTGSAAAGAVAGSLFAFAPFRLNHLAHLQLQTTGFLPLAFLCAIRYLESARLRDALGVAVFFFMTSLSCAYYGVFTGLALVVAVAWAAARRFEAKRVVGLTLALGLSGLAQLPFVLPYVRLATDFGFERPLARVERASALPRDYLRSTSHVHRAVGLPAAGPEQALFPGFLAAGLGVLGIFRGGNRRSLFVLVSTLAFWGSLGPRAGLYLLLHEWVPGVSGLRVPARLSILVLFSLAVLASWGAAFLLRRSRRLAGLLIALPLVESFGGPIPYARAPVEPPAVYTWLQSMPGSIPIAELPLPLAPLDRARNATYMLWSTTHFKPLANGYSALVPPSYDELARAIVDFPSESAVQALRARGIGLVVFHKDLVLRERAREVERQLEGTKGLRELYRTETEIALEVVR